MKVTKRPKSTIVLFEEFKTTYIRTKYTCPSCKVQFHGVSISGNASRFFCQCGQELIIKKESTK